MFYTQHTTIHISVTIYFISRFVIIILFFFLQEDFKHIQANGDCLCKMAHFSSIKFCIACAIYSVFTISSILYPGFQHRSLFFLLFYIFSLSVYSSSVEWRRQLFQLTNKKLFHFTFWFFDSILFILDGNSYSSQQSSIHYDFFLFNSS